MITQSPHSGNENHDAEYYEIWLGPYLGNRAVNDDQLQQALDSGLTVRESHDRLEDAECLLMTAYDLAAWDRGWFEAIDVIRWLDSDENRRDEDTELFYGDLREFADDIYQELRRGCYSSSLTTGAPVLDVPLYSTACGRCSCLDAGMIFPDQTDNSELADILGSTTDLKELQQIAAQQREEAYLAARDRIAGMINVLGHLQRIGGAK
jgi:hypothetical protein